MNTAKFRHLLTVAAMTLIAAVVLQAPAASQDEDLTTVPSPDAALCNTLPLPDFLGDASNQDPVEQQTCGPCILNTCGGYYIRCTYVGCGVGNCCRYTCACDPTCTSGTPPGGACRLFFPSCCGNGVQEPPDEDCDVDDLGGTTCMDLGFEGGTLGCDGICNFDTTECYKCGDGKCNPGEDCETCASDCDGRHTGKPSERFCCGNGILEAAEEGGAICDGNP